MIRQERTNDPELAFRQSFRGSQAEIWTALPGIVQSFDAAAQTCVVQPTIMMPIRGEDEQFVATALPLLTDCPVHFPSGGNCTLTFPVKVGDECLVVFSSRCIDSWWQSGGVQEQAERRMHDLSDGFVFVGVRSQPRTIPGISTSVTQLRSDDGAAFFELDPSSHKLRIVAPGGLEVVTPHATFSERVTVTGLFTFLGGLVGSAVAGAAAKITGAINFIGTLTSNGKLIDDTHQHSGVQPGSGTSGPVT